MISIKEHNARVEEMKASADRMQKWVDDPRMHVPWAEKIRADVRLLLERIDAYEASISWHTDCLMCPKLLDQNLLQHEALQAARKILDEPFVGGKQFDENVQAFRSACARVKP